MCSGILKNKKGSALLYVVLVIFIVITISGFMINMLTYEIKVNKITEKKLKAKYLAEAGIEQAMLEHGEKDAVLVYDDAGNALYQYSVSVSEGAMSVEAYGYADNDRKVRINCEIRNDAFTKWEETELK